MTPIPPAIVDTTSNSNLRNITINVETKAQPIWIPRRESATKIIDLSSIKVRKLPKLI